MSFFERARAGYDNLAGRTDDAFDRATASKDLGEIDKHYRDLGVLAYLAATGRPADQATQQRLVGALTALEQRGAIRDFTLHTTGGSPAGAPQSPQREGGSDGIPTPPPERAGRHGDFLSQPRDQAFPASTMPPPAPPAAAGAGSGGAGAAGGGAPGQPERTWPASDPDETTGPRPVPPPPPPSTGGTWGPPQQDNQGPTRWQPVRRGEE